MNRDVEFSLQELEAYIAKERLGDEIMRRYFRVYGWRTMLNWPNGNRWYGIKEYISLRFSVADESSVALFRLEAHFVGLHGDARKREYARLSRKR